MKHAAATAVSPPLMVQLWTTVHSVVSPHSHVSYRITAIPYTCTDSSSSVHLVYSLHQLTPTWLVFDISGALVSDFFYSNTNWINFGERSKQRSPSQ